MSTPATTVSPIPSQTTTARKSGAWGSTGNGCETSGYTTERGRPSCKDNPVTWVKMQCRRGGGNGKSGTSKGEFLRHEKRQYRGFSLLQVICFSGFQKLICALAVLRLSSSSTPATHNLQIRNTELRLLTPAFLSAIFFFFHLIRILFSNSMYCIYVGKHLL